MSTARIMLAGTGSGSGKTAITCGLLQALRWRGLAVAACKCGPDYIDPMFHREVLGAPSRNLDLFLSGEQAVRALLADSLAGADIALIEGVMGFYDGIGGGVEASSCQLAQCTETPVVLVVDCRGKALSLAAELQGFVRFLPNNIAGILLNRCTARSYPMLQALVQQHTGLPVLGYLPRLEEAALESRHLGLVTAQEVEHLREKVEVLARAVAQSVDLDALLALAATAPPLAADPLPVPAVPVPVPVRIAVARDAAFCFCYEDNLLLLRRLGAEIVPFSPLQDSALPPDIGGVILPGGYPELYAEQLSANTELLRELRERLAGGLPTLAECGGMLLLCRSLQTADGTRYPMAGAIDTAGKMTGQLSRFGYVTLAAQRQNLLCAAGETLRAHEFHYSEVENPGDAFCASKPDGRRWNCVHATETLYAGYPHLHLWGNQNAARQFVKRCAHS